MPCGSEASIWKATWLALVSGLGFGIPAMLHLWGVVVRDGLDYIAQAAGIARDFERRK